MNNNEQKRKYVFYIHRNIVNGKVYVGQTVQLPSRRWHKGEGYKGCTYFYAAIVKYGWNNFEHIILEEFEGTYSEAGFKEQQYMDIYKSQDPDYGYNIRDGGTSNNGMVQAAVAWMEQHPEFLQERVKEMHKWQKEHPEEARKIIQLFNQSGINARKRKVRCVETGTIYESATEAARQIPKTSQGKICMCCRGQRERCGGFHWEYVEDKEYE